MDNLTGFQRDLMYVIADAERPSGQAIQAELDDYYTDDITHGRLYPNLDTLVTRGLVEKGELDQRTNYYTLTDVGDDQLRTHHTWTSQYIES